MRHEIPSAGEVVYCSRRLHCKPGRIRGKHPEAGPTGTIVWSHTRHEDREASGLIGLTPLHNIRLQKRKSLLMWIASVQTSSQPFGSFQMSETCPPVLFAVLSQAQELGSCRARKLYHDKTVNKMVKVQAARQVTNKYNQHNIPSASHSRKTPIQEDSGRLPSGVPEEAQAAPSVPRKIHRVQHLQTPLLPSRNTKCISRPACMIVDLHG